MLTKCDETQTHKWISKKSIKWSENFWLNFFFESLPNGQAMIALLLEGMYVIGLSTRRNNVKETRVQSSEENSKNRLKNYKNQTSHKNSIPVFLLRFNSKKTTSRSPQFSSFFNYIFDTNSIDLPTDY